ncbi:MAG: class I SAM-dependent methyltransferase [Nitrospiraceae bacterium]|nr:MAG: class I SAM-dependent methyltransferase [Nitrospiraceae bacterium]
MGEIEKEGIATDIREVIDIFLKTKDSFSVYERFFSDEIEYKKHRVLDVGLGIGTYIKALSDRGVNNVFGFDIVYELVEVAKKRFGIRNVITSNALRIPFKDNVFDAVLCYNLIEHVSLPDSVISEVYRVLRDGGKLYIDFPNANSLGDIAFRWGGIVLRGRTSHIQKFTKKRAIKLLESNGFKINRTKELRGFTFGFPVLNRIWFTRKLQEVLTYLVRNAISGWEIEAEKCI